MQAVIYYKLVKKSLAFFFLGNIALTYDAIVKADAMCYSALSFRQNMAVKRIYALLARPT
jgi:hypothetical protein